MIDQTSLYNLFITENKSCKEIAKIYNCSASWIHKKLKQFGISVQERRLKRKFGKLKVIKRGKTDKYGHPYWICKCDCGNEIEVVGSALSTSRKIKVKGNTLSCGCAKIGKESVLYSGYMEISGTLWDAIQNNAEKRNLEFTITLKEVWNLFIRQNKKCALSGLPIQFSKKSKSRDRTASLDRIDNTKGYIIDNVQWIHKDINRMKSDFNQEYFIEMCQSIINNRSVNH